jgi:hypothetical protein
MNQARPTINYEEFKALNNQERVKIFNAISAENRALLMKTQVENWLAENRSQLHQEQLAVVEEIIRFAKPEMYEEDRDYLKVTQEADKLIKKAEAVFSREETMEMTFVSGGQCSIRQSEKD